MFFVLLWGIIAGAATVETAHYHQCRSDHFKGHACHFEKELDSMKPSGRM